MLTNDPFVKSKREEQIGEESLIKQPKELLVANSCLITNILEVISKKWAILILRELIIYDQRRFHELSKSLSNISPRTLSSRLKELEEQGLLIREQFNEIPPRVVYSLTTKGNDLGNCFKNLDEWVRKWSHGQ